MTSKNSPVKTITIHGNEYIPVAERVRLAHEELKEDFSIATELIASSPVVVMKAIVTTPKGSFSAFSAANPAKTIEKQSPYEVAETSAVGRALGFAGYGLIDGIATADEMAKPAYSTYNQRASVEAYNRQETALIPENVSEVSPVSPRASQAVMDDYNDVPRSNELYCEICGEPATEKKGNTKGKAWHGIFCTSQDRSHTKWL